MPVGAVGYGLGGSGLGWGVWGVDLLWFGCDRPGARGNWSTSKLLPPTRGG